MNIRKIMLLALMIFIIITALTGCKKYVVKDDLTPRPTYLGNNQRTVNYQTKITSYKIKWSYTTKNQKQTVDTLPGIKTQPIIYKGLVFFGDDSNYLRALDTETGKEKWHFLYANNKETLRGLQSTPAISNNTLYFAGTSDYFYALDAKTGKKKWQFASDTGGSSPIVHDDTVFFNGDYLYALDKNTGKLKWKTKIYSLSFIYSMTTPAFAYDLVFCSDGVRRMNAFDSKTGKRIWSYKTGGGPVYSEVTSPVIYKGSIYFGSQDGYIYSLNALNGKLNWKKNVVKYTGAIAPPVVDREAVYYFADATMNAFNYKTGKIKWKYETQDDQVAIPPTITNNNVLIGLSEYPYIIVINKKTGDEVKTIKANAEITTPITIE